jgi:hypothetical protein
VPTDSSPVRQRAASAAAALQSVIADVKSRFKLADQIGIPRSVFDALVTAAGSETLDAGGAAPAGTAKRRRSDGSQPRRSRKPPST